MLELMKLSLVEKAISHDDCRIRDNGANDEPDEGKSLLSK